MLLHFLMVGALFRTARNDVILGNFLSMKLLSGSFPNFQGILVHIQTIKILFLRYGTRAPELQTGDCNGGPISSLK